LDPLTRRLLWGLGTGIVCLVGGSLWARLNPAGPEDPDFPLPVERERLVLSEDVRSGQTGSISYRGDVWSVRNEAGRDLKAGETVIVERVEPTHTLVVSSFTGIVERS
jgi:hypothetical protein